MAHAEPVASVYKTCMLASNKAMKKMIISLNLLVCATIDLELSCSLVSNMPFGGWNQPWSTPAFFRTNFPFVPTNLVKRFHPCDSLCTWKPNQRTQNRSTLLSSLSLHILSTQFAFLCSRLSTSTLPNILHEVRIPNHIAFL